MPLLFLHINIQGVLRNFSETFYTFPIMIAFQLFAVYICFFKRNKFRELKNFYLYPFVSFLQGLSTILGILFLEENLANTVAQFTINVFSLAEISFIYYLMMQVLLIKKLRIVLRYSFLAYIIFTSTCWIFTDTLFYNAARILCAEAIIGLMAVCFYYYQVFKIPIVESLLDQPTFWISLGTLFLFSCTLPLTTLELLDKEFVQDNFYFNYINFISYSVLYLFVIRGYFSKKVGEHLQKSFRLN